MGKITVLLADDHAVLRTGLRMLINAQPDMEVVGEAADGREAIEAAEQFQPDVLLLDLTMPGLGGLSALGVIREKAPGTKVLVLTMHDDEGYLRQVLRSGGSGYVVKRAADVELLSAIRAVKRGEVYVHSSMTKALVGGVFDRRVEREAGSSDRFDDLSDREKEVLRLLARGYTNQQIADMLFLSVKTIETYRARLMEKLKLRTRAELVHYALKKGLLCLDS
ncbi:MAG: response regulator transcription factor [candidate division NC10 bacterium]|nr:response regulator transcription factor [candidate division NC10 bacterium]